MHPTSIYSHLKDFLADLTNRPRKDIRAEMRLSQDPPDGLGFTEHGLMRVATDLNEYFKNVVKHPLEPRLVPSDTANATTVRELYKLLKTRV